MPRAALGMTGVRGWFGLREEWCLGWCARAQCAIVGRTRDLGRGTLRAPRPYQSASPPVPGVSFARFLIRREPGAVGTGGRGREGVMLLPDEENLPTWLRAELAARREECGPFPAIRELREARRRLSPRARAYLRELTVRAMVAEEALRMLASGELADVRFD